MIEDAGVVVAITDAEVKNRVDKLERPERDSFLRFLTELESHAPAIRAFISKIESMGALTGSRVGRPPVFKDRESEREACRMVLAEIAKGFSEAESKRRVATKLDIDPQTINRTWKNRNTIIELSSSEVISRLLTLWQTGTLWQADGSNRSKESR
jgi:hypothetical protein